jgi:hypothetical protein
MKTERWTNLQNTNYLVYPIFLINLQNVTEIELYDKMLWLLYTKTLGLFLYTKTLGLFLYAKMID